MMQTNFSEVLNNLQEKKQNLLALANKAVENGWIPQNKTANKNLISLEEIKEKLDKDTLTIGVIGQMKCGKSTFLNAFIFEDDVLPAATTPMTAALSVITYGEEKKIVAEFYTADEWAEQQQQASRSLEGVEGLEESKIKAAKELVAKSKKLGSTLNSLLGTTKEDTFDNLIEYVGADGKYISITKSVTIYYPKEYLKGVEIVDTPGFNDPIVSREERTKAFLKKADVVLMMLYAGRPFDATDRDIIFKNVRQCGIGKVLVGINKYDIPFCNGEDENTIKDYVKAELRKACKECNDDTLVDILKEVEPIPLSAEMALLAELPMSKISQSEALDFAWKRHCDGFGIGSQPEMRKWSHIDDLVTAVKDLVEKEKEKILFSKPLNAISAAGDKVMSDNDRELNKVQERITDLNLPETELDEKADNLNKANKRITKKIKTLGEDIEAELNQIVRKGKEELEDTVDSTCNKMTSIIENEFGRLTNINNLTPKLNKELDILVTRTLKRTCNHIAQKGENKIKGCINDFFAEGEDILMRFFPEFDSRHFIKTTQSKIEMSLENGKLFAAENSQGGDSDYGFMDGVFDFFNGATFGLLSVMGKAFSHDSVKRDVLNWINSISADFDPTPYLQNVFHRKDEIIELVKQAFITELIEPLQEQIQEIRSKQDQKDKLLAEAKQKRQVLEAKKQEIQAQYDEFVQMRMGFFGR